jgi:hypothetical protein
VDGFDGDLPWELTVYPEEYTIGQRVCLDKPFIVLDALSHLEPDELLMYMDLDVLLCNRTDELETMKFDVAVACKGSPRGHGTCNAGILYFRNNERAKRFLLEWIAFMTRNFGKVRSMVDARSIGDQIFLNRFVDSVLGKGAKKKNRYKEIGGATVYFLEDTYYNRQVKHLKNLEDPRIFREVNSFHMYGGRDSTRSLRPKYNRIATCLRKIQESRNA